MATDAKISSVDGLAYGRIRFVGYTQHGKQRRQIRLECSADAILALADAIRGCQQNYEDPKTGARPESLDEAQSNRRFEPTWMGHAVWHLEHPDRIMPCLPHGTQIIEIPLESTALVRRVR